MNMEPKISLITCVYGAEAYIHKCLDSLLNQTYTNLEFVIIDDGSPDKCPQICDEYAAKDKRIHLVHQKNAGYGVARNVGLKTVTGDFVGFVDPDDWIDKDMMQGMAQAITKHGADIVVCDWKTYPDMDEEHGELHTQNIDNTQPFEKIRDLFLLDQKPNFLCNKLFARSLFEGLTIPPDIVLGDLYVCGELFARSHKIFYIPQGYYCYRVHASFANTRAKTRRKYGMFMAWREHERVALKYGINSVLPYSRQRAQKAAISLKVLDQAQPYLTREQEEDLDAYLAQMPEHMAALPLKHKLLFWSLQHTPCLSKKFGDVSVYFDGVKQKRKFGK